MGAGGGGSSETKPTEIPQSAYCFSISRLLSLLVEYCSNSGNQTSAPPQLHLSLTPLVAGGGDLPFAGVDLFPLRALLALDVAAPAHLTLARPGHLPALRVVASPAADCVAVLVLVALAGRRARRVLAGSTEARRVLNVKQVHSAGDLIAQAGQGLGLLWMLAPACGDLPLPRGLVRGASHLDGGLVALLQLLADLVEGQELPPAGLDRARARDAVAFAGGLHPGLDYLVGRQ